MSCLHGSCHCTNIEVTVELSAPPAGYAPRACDCDFCVKHGAAYIADPQGRLTIRVKEAASLRRYRQGSGTAECLLCGTCGVLVAVVFRAPQDLFGVVNVRAIDRNVVFGDATLVSPKTLSPAEKIERWSSLWFAQVRLEGAPWPNSP